MRSSDDISAHNLDIVKPKKDFSAKNMNWFKKIVVKISLFILRLKMKSIKRDKAFFNFESAKTVGIIFDATHQDLYLKARSFIAALKKKGIKVKALGYVGSKEAITYFRPHESIEFFSINNSNWHYMPKNLEVKEFMNSEFDMLINLSLDEYIPLKYIIGLTNAKIKLGKYLKDIELYDFILQIEEGKSLDFYIKQLVHYMSVIRKAS